MTGGSQRRRRALVVASPSFSVALEKQLAAGGYEVLHAAPGQASQAVLDSRPEVALIAVGGSVESEAEAVSLARRLRAQPETYALPLVFLYERDERRLRNAALQIGADDYFAVSTPQAEICARLDALFWRTEAGRRHAPVVAEQRSEIDNFLLLLDAVRADAEDGATGTLGLIGDVPGAMNLHAADTGRLLAEAHGFFKLQLRRVDGVSFYGPTILLVYLPRRDAKEAQATLARLREQFLETQQTGDLAIGLTSFPADGIDVETLIERAEMGLNKARLPDAPSRVAAADGAKSYAWPVSTAAPALPVAADVAESPSPLIEEPPVPFVEATGGQEEPSTGASLEAARAGDGRALPTVESSEQDEAVAAAAPLPALAGIGIEGGVESNALLEAALEAGTRERERRAAGVVMPRRLLLTVSDATRMAQLNSLIRSAGYEVRAAFDGQQALSLLRIERPDLVLVDFELLDMDGTEMLRRLRKQSGGRVKLPVLVLLPPHHQSARPGALEAGARNVIMMPCDPSELLDSVRAAGTAR